MSVDPRTLDMTDAELYAAVDEVDRLRAILVPLHNAWLQANPPCPTCGGEAQVCDPETGWMACPDCPDGVQPFDKWTARLVALWTAVHDPEVALTVMPKGNTIGAYIDAVLRALRQIGGTR